MMGPWTCRASKMGRGEKREDEGKNLGPSSIGGGYTRAGGDTTKIKLALIFETPPSENSVLPIYYYYYFLFRGNKNPYWFRLSHPQYHRVARTSEHHRAHRAYILLGKIKPWLVIFLLWYCLKKYNKTRKNPGDNIAEQSFTPTRNPYSHRTY